MLGQEEQEPRESRAPEGLLGHQEKPAFCDGIFWVDCGPDCDVVQKQQKLLRDLREPVHLLPPSL